MTPKEFKVIKARIHEELKNIDSLKAEIEKKQLYGELTGMNYDSFFIRSLGSILHDFYVAVENTLKIVCSELDEVMPEGAQWHVLLLKQACYELTGIRPAIISRTTMLKLDKYRAFRHVFRNVYGFNLDSERIKELLLDLPITIKMFKEDISNFMNLFEEPD